ncbi:hypothetical protein [Chitinophaga pinensis]|uniref:Uncharacterized protein n=1 Tax=Chitinophaga pinensis (strain ATCC 43595 / DSM 2588 / LMG 13176 / NBRC 15968 / NCIMB 11800 / UQM 2034) TaxID=485918 RepID=A0A979G565_CHIPD|nr:hypothetical protein [Chitinophaga pinensis]ACU61044.1 hypothetical protein Cpin_3581 [Chitinophaga pinensis DSM 2588]
MNEGLDRILNKGKREMIMLLVAAAILSIVAVMCYRYSHYWALLPFGFLPVPLYMLRKYKKVILYEPDKNWVIMQSVCILMIIGIAESRIYETIYVLNDNRLFIFVGILLGIFLLMGWWYSRGLDRRSNLFLWSTALAIFLVTANAYMLVMYVNRLADTSVAERYETTVADRQIREDKKSKSYQLALRPWKYGRDRQEVTVSQQFFDSKYVDSQVAIYYHKGGLGISWFTLDPKVTE